MKYEPVFGDQSLFDDAPEDAEMAASVCQMPRWYTMFNGKVLFCDSKKESWQSADFNHPGSQLLAMRRIIAEPKRWTVEDQKAGRLPEVGCEYIGRDVLLTCVLVDKNRDVWGKSKDNLMYCHDYSEIKPIETPEEKAARLCNEWCKTAADIFVRHPSCSATESLGGIYKAMLSGDLPVPVKE